MMTTTQVRERTEQTTTGARWVLKREEALDTFNGNEGAVQSHNVTDQVYCEQHGVVKSAWGHCAECLDEGYRDWDATRSAKTLIPSWTGINVDGRTVIVARVRDALGAVEALGRYRHSNAIVLILWGELFTALDNGQIGPHWVLNNSRA